MSFFTSLSILILVSLIQASLQLVPSIFMIFYHYASGKKSRKTADSLALFFLLGVETFATIMFLSIYSIYYSVFFNFPSIELKIFPWVLAGITLALSIVSFFFYFRKSNGTELFLSRKLAKNLLFRAKSVKTRSDAFALGFFTSIGELIFNLPLFILAVVSINQFNDIPRSPFASLFIIASAIPVISVFAMYHAGYNLAEIERRRIKDKTFFRFVIPLGFLLLAFSLFSMGVFK